MIQSTITKALLAGAVEAYSVGNGVRVVFEQFGNAPGRLVFVVYPSHHVIEELSHGPEASFWARTVARKLEGIVSHAKIAA